MRTGVAQLGFALLFTVLLASQAAAARQLPNRRRAFGLLALLTLIFAAYSGAQLAGLVSGPFPAALLIVCLVLLVAAAACYILSVRHGEINKQYDTYLSGMQKYARRREEKNKP